MRIAALGVAAVVAVGCAQRPESITPRFTSATSYRALQCDALNDERRRVGAELQRVVALQRENANADAAMMGVGVLLFPPLLFGLAATTDRREQIAQMMGERDAMELAAREKGCPAVSIPAAPAESAPTAVPST